MATKNLKLRLKNNGPLLMHSAKLANPLDEAAITLKKLMAIRKKTEEINMEIARQSYLGSIYCESSVIGIPSTCVEAAVTGAAKLRKLGKVVGRAVMIAEPHIALNYDGPQDPDGLWADSSFRDCRSVVIGASRVMRYRPVFRNWTMDVDFSYDDQQIDPDTLLEIVCEAGTKIGLCDYRPKFGRFTVELSNI